MIEMEKNTYADRSMTPALAGNYATKRGGLAALLRRYRAFFLIVILPTLAVGTYLNFFAADQYVSEARFTVQSASQTEGSSSLLGMVFGGGGATMAGSESYSVADYLQSHDAVSALEKDVGLVAMYRRENADPVFRLWWANPTQEELLKYYNRMVKISFDTQSNIAIMRIFAFRRDDAQKIAERLLELGEQRVNDISHRAEADTVKVAQTEVSAAEKRVADVEQSITEFRTKQQLIDPTKSAGTLLTIVGGLETQLAQSRAQFAAQSSYLSPQSPQYEALTQRIAALEKQIDTVTNQMTGPQKNTLAPILSKYEHILLEREFAGREYTAALSSLENARMQALKQHLFVARVVTPNLPDESTYPERFLTTLTVFLVLLVVFGIGWLIYAGTKEHAA